MRVDADRVFHRWPRWSGKAATVGGLRRRCESNLKQETDTVSNLMAMRETLTSTGWGKGGWGYETKFSLAIGMFLLQVLLRLRHSRAGLDVISRQAPGEFAAVPHD